MPEKPSREESEDFDAAASLIGRHYPNYVIMAHRNVDGTSQTRGVKTGDAITIRGLIAYYKNEIDLKMLKGDDNE